MKTLFILVVLLCMSFGKCFTVATYSSIAVIVDERVRSNMVGLVNFNAFQRILNALQCILTFANDSYRIYSRTSIIRTRGDLSRKSG